MERPTWTGNITFGLVNVPVSLYAGERRTDISFRLLDSRDKARIRYERVNEITGKEVPWDQTVKAYEYEDDKYVLLTEDDLKHVAVEANKTVEIEDFVRAGDIPLKYFDKPYILVPTKQGQKPYVLLREVLKQTKMAGIARVVIRTRQYLAAVLPEGDALLLCVLRFAKELKDYEEYPIPDAPPAQYKVTSREIEIGVKLVESMSAKWNPEKYRDEYQETLLAWINEKMDKEGGTRLPAEIKDEPRPEGKIVDIMDLLKRSVEQRTKPQKGAPKERSNITRLPTKAKGKAAPTKKSAASKRKPAAKRRAS